MSFPLWVTEKKPFGTCKTIQKIIKIKQNGTIFLSSYGNLSVCMDKGWKNIDKNEINYFRAMRRNMSELFPLKIFSYRDEARDRT